MVPIHSVGDVDSLSAGQILDGRAGRTTQSGPVPDAPESDRGRTDETVRTVINNRPIPGAPSSGIAGSSLASLNHGTDGLKGSGEVNTLTSGKAGPIVKDAEALPEDVQELLDRSGELKSAIGKAKGIKERVALLPEIERTFDALAKALREVEPGSDSEFLQIDRTSGDAVGLDARADSLATAKELLDVLEGLRNEVRSQVPRDFHVRRFGLEISLLKKGEPARSYAELLEAIDKVPQDELTPRDREDLRKEVLDAYRSAVRNEVCNDVHLRAAIAKAAPPVDGGEVIDAAARILVRIRLHRPDLEPPIRIDGLFRNFIGSMSPDKPGLAGRFCKVLTDLATAADPASKMDPRLFCLLVDRLAGPADDHYAPLGGLMKEALAPDARFARYAKAQHEYKVAAKELLLVVAEKLNGKTLGVIPADVRSDFNRHVMTRKGLEALAGLPFFQDIRNQVADLVRRQCELIRDGVADLADAIRGDDRFSDVDLAKATPDDLERLREEVASGLVAQLAEAFGDKELQELAAGARGDGKPADGKAGPGEVATRMAERIGTFADDFSVRSIRGRQDAENVAKTLRTVSDKIVGRSPEGNLSTFYDGNIGNQTAKTMDEVYLQLTGEYDPEKRQMIKTTDRSRLTKDLIDGIGFSLSEALCKDSAKRLKVDDTSKGITTIRELLFDRAKAGGFDAEGMDKGIDEAIRSQEAAYDKIKGIRHKVATSLSHEEDFAARNQEAIRLHARKKRLNAVVKTHRANADAIFTCFWRWGARKANVGKVLELDRLKGDLDRLKAERDTQLERYDGVHADDLGRAIEAYETCLHRVNVLFDELRTLDLSNFSSHGKDVGLSLEEFLGRAAPLAKAFDYLRISKTVKNDLAEIRQLKRQRDQSRKKLDAYLSEAESAYGKEVVLQIRRAAVIADHLARLDHGGVEPKDFEIRCRNVFAFLKGNVPMMKDCDRGIARLLVEDALRRYAPPAGSGMTGRRLARIRDELGKGRGDSLVLGGAKEDLKAKYGKEASGLLERYETTATRMYLDRGAEGLMGMVSEKGQSFVYTKDKKFTVATLPLLFNASISYMPSESFGVVNNGDGYTVLVKSEHAARIALAAGIWPENMPKAIGAFTLAGHASAEAKFGSGLAISFKDAESVKGFIKDFMTPDSPIHKGEPYNPSWRGSSDIRFVSSTALSGEVGATVDFMIRSTSGSGPATNQIQVGNAKYAEIKDLDGYAESMDTGTHGNRYVGMSIKLPTASFGVTASGGTKEDISRSHGVVTRRSSSRFTFEMKAELTPVQVKLAFKPVSHALWGLMSGIAWENGADGLMSEIEATIERGLKVTGGPDKETDAFIKETEKEFLDRLRRGETDKAEEMLGDLFARSKDSTLEAFIGGESDSPFVTAMQAFATVALVEHRMNYAVSLTERQGAYLDSGINLQIGPLSTLGQVVSEEISNVMRAEDWKANPTGDGRLAEGTMSTITDWKRRLGTVLGHVDTAVSAVKTIVKGSNVNVLAAASLVVGDVLKGGKDDVVAGKYGNISAGIDRSKIVSVSGEYRGGHLQVGGEASLGEGVKVHAAVNFTGTCDDEHVVTYDEAGHKFTDDTGIDRSVRKEGFTLENLLGLFQLPKELQDAMGRDQALMDELTRRYSQASDDDVITLRMRIKPEVLATLNGLEMSRTMVTGKEKEVIEQRIEAILQDTGSFAPAAIDITHTAAANVNFTRVPERINLMLFSMDYHRTLVNGTTVTVPLDDLVVDAKPSKDAPALR